ncbi:hypothetical protein MYSTI_04092 [Myxococcus stipitatus DSM 14675]|uniref:Uncharacterized protein n=1 Tax=Myxococcus stipitatus (strain DSM 14675 / JCM 12634 / Mx s8) TaxID=1278073 RepID=L7UBH0_MYXSD|nr:hypothetical protein [Myxococcus stipitatus]AGC45393.1 hypothetical protein MYSTI_04092 [Myxococcus stipitatus DSM 14675]
MKNSRKKLVRRLAEAALDVVRYTRKGSEVEGVFVGGLVADLEATLGLDPEMALELGYELSNTARRQYATWVRGGV